MVGRLLDLTLTIKDGVARIDFKQLESGDHVVQKFPVTSLNDESTWAKVGGEVCSWLSLMADEEE